jgi:hypothetical protein
VLQNSGSSSQRTRTWCRTGDALRTRTRGTVTVSEVETPEKKDGWTSPTSKQKRQGLPGSLKMRPARLRPSPSLGRRGSRKATRPCTPMKTSVGAPPTLLTLFRPAPGLLRAKGVLSAPNAVVHPWLKGELTDVLAEMEKKQPAESLPPEAERPLDAQWETWLGHPSRNLSLPP